MFQQQVLPRMWPGNETMQHLRVGYSCMSSPQCLGCWRMRDSYHEIGLNSSLLCLAPGESFVVGGRHCETLQETLVAVIEHELVHASLYTMYVEEYAPEEAYQLASQHGPEFEQLAHLYFGHTSSHAHKLQLAKAVVHEEDTHSVFLEAG